VAPVRTNEALVFVHARSNEGAVSSGGKAANDPLMGKLGSRKRRSSTARAEREVAARATVAGDPGFGGDGGDVQHASKFAESIQKMGAPAQVSFAVARASAGCN